jgi:hypothetical protein
MDTRSHRTARPARRWLAGLVMVLGAVVAPVSAAAAATTVFVPAYQPESQTNHYVDTGVTLQSGQQVRISATGSAWCGNYDANICGNGNGPDGVGKTGDAVEAYVYNTYGIDYGRFTAGSLIAFSLIGKVGSGSALQLGSAARTVSGGGRLYLAYNDNYYEDNTGGFTVTIQRCVFGLCF